MIPENPPSTVATRSLLRERAARKEAETLLEQKSRDLYEINLNLRQLNAYLEDSESRYRSLVDLIPDAIWIHADGCIVFMNPAAVHLFGASNPLQLLGTRAIDRIPERWRHHMEEATYADIHTAQQKPRSALQVERMDGVLVEVELFGAAIRFNKADCIMQVAHDVTERRAQEKAIEHQATHDQLTGLPNRALFLDRLTHAIRRAERHHGNLAVMFVDLDKFKYVNDTLGHGAGDDLLRSVAAALGQCVRDSDTVGRLGGDEFVLLLDHPIQENTPSMIAQRISERLAVPVLLAGQEHVVTGSIGISMYPSDGAKAEVLLRQADIAMYRAKENGRNSFEFFTGEMQKRVDARVSLEQGLHRALQREEFVLYYQPQVDLHTGRICGMEALIRWASPELGLVSPAQFIPVAEESNLIVAIGDWVLNKACATLRCWIDAGVPVVPLAVNVAASQFAHQDMEHTVAQALQRYGVDARLLELELTESLSMEDPEASIALMHKLKQTGIAMSIDDFGTGYSNLSYLKRFPVDKLKIDQSFTRGLTSNPEDRSIVNAVIRLAHSLGLRAIAEGVETEGQLRLLAAQGCDEIQGYYFSRPMPEAGMVAMLQQQSCLDLARIDRSAALRAILLVDDDPFVLDSFAALLHDLPYQLLTARTLADAYEVMAGKDVGVVISDQLLIGETGIDFFARIKHMYPGTIRILLTGDTRSATLADAINQGEIFKFIGKPWDNEQVLGILDEAFQAHSRHL